MVKFVLRFNSIELTFRFFKYFRISSDLGVYTNMGRSSGAVVISLSSHSE